MGAQSNACNQGIACRSNRCSAPAALAAATAIGPNTTKLSTQSNATQRNILQPGGKDNQSASSPEPATRAGSLGASRGRRTNCQKSRNWVRNNPGFVVVGERRRAFMVYSSIAGMQNLHGLGEISCKQRWHNLATTRNGGANCCQLIIARRF